MRNWIPGDAGALVKHANNPLISANMRDSFPYPYTFDDAKLWLNFARHEEKDLFLAIDMRGEAIGGIGIHFFFDVYRINAEVGYWLSEIYWSNGIVTEAVSTLVAYIFEKYDVTRIFAGVFESNTASMRVLEKCGFIREAIHKNCVIKNSKVMDEYIWAVYRSS